MSASAGRARQTLSDPNEDYSWQEQAACKGHDLNLWFPEQHSKDGAKARKICRGCPVQEPCLQYAIRTDQAFGIWANTNRNERVTIRRRALLTPEPVSKRCPACDTWKPADGFSSNRSRKNGLAVECRACASLRDRRRHQKRAS